MATATRKQAPPDVCRLTAHIRGEPYSVRILAADPAAGVSALVRLRKADGTAYHVAMTEHGQACDCGDWTFRRDGIDPAGCKHVRACVALGLVRGGGR